MLNTPARWVLAHLLKALVAACHSYCCSIAILEKLLTKFLPFCACPDCAWLLRSIKGFAATNDMNGVERNMGNFMLDYRQAPPADREKMKAKWLAAGLPPFPEPESESNNPET